MAGTAVDFEGRKAPYAPISALEKFFQRIRDTARPDRVDHNYLRKLSIAHNNEYSLLSALKFLGVVDQYGEPTTAYRRLQTTDQFEDTLWERVQDAYRPLFDVGLEGAPIDELVNFFRVSSSASQAKNAARFFRAVCSLGGRRPWESPLPHLRIQPENGDVGGSDVEDLDLEADMPAPGASDPVGTARPVSSAEILAVKADLLQKLPAPRPDWSAEQYLQICDRFVTMLRHLDNAG